jgi:hypothetical protein
VVLGIKMLRSSFSLGVVLCSLAGCSTALPTFGTPPAERDQYNCVIPTQHVILNRNQLVGAGESMGGFASGKIDYKTQPELMNLISTESKDATMIDYSLCGAVARREVTTQEQIDHFRSRLHFMSGTPHPTPEQIDKWQKDHPFPLSDQDKSKLKEEEATERAHRAELKAAQLEVQLKKLPEAEKARVDSNTKNRKSR